MEPAEGDSAAADAALSLELTMARQYFDLVAQWLSGQGGEAAEWREAARFGDSLLQLTAAELRLLNDQIDELVRPFRAGAAPPGAHPEGTRQMVMLHLVVPSVLAEPGDRP